jgi:hypothetical protein
LAQESGQISLHGFEKQSTETTKNLPVQSIDPSNE